MNKLLGQRKKFNLNLSSSSSSSSEEESHQPIVLNRFNISLTICGDGSLVINSTEATTTTSELGEAETSDALCNSFEVPKVRKQRTNSQRSARTPFAVLRSNSDFVDETSDDEAFMNNSANFQKSPRPLRRSLRKRKTSSLKRRRGVQTVPEIEQEVEVPVVASEPRRTSVTALDTTLDDTLEGDFSIQWIENEYYSTTDAQSSESGCQLISEKSLIIANAETEDALTESDCNPTNEVFKMPFPVSYRPNLSKRKLVVESDEEYISTAFRGPVKRSCIRYYY